MITNLENSKKNSTVGFKKLSRDDPYWKEQERLEAEKLLIVWKSVMEFSQNAIRSVILANGAAATAILTYAKEQNAQFPRHLAIAALVFALGVTFGVLSSAFAYLSQYDVIVRAIENNNRLQLFRGPKRTAGIMLVFAGLAMFVFGVAVATLDIIR